MARYKESYVGERLTAALRVQLTPSQRQQLEMAAVASGARLSDYIRELSLAKTQPIVAGVRRNPEAKALLNELRRIGNNLNQLTHHANASESLPAQQELQQVTTLLKAAMARVITL